MGFYFIHVIFRRFVACALYFERRWFEQKLHFRQCLPSSAVLNKLLKTCEHFIKEAKTGQRFVTSVLDHFMSIPGIANLIIKSQDVDTEFNHLHRCRHVQLHLKFVISFCMVNHFVTRDCVEDHIYLISMMPFSIYFTSPSQRAIIRCFSTVWSFLCSDQSSLLVEARRQCSRQILGIGFSFQHLKLGLI